MDKDIDIGCREYKGHIIDKDIEDNIYFRSSKTVKSLFLKFQPKLNFNK